MPQHSRVFSKKTFLAIAILSASSAISLIIFPTHESHATEEAMPAIPVTTITTQKSPVQIWQEFSGRTRAVNYAEIRPEVSGRITAIHFKDGDTVKKNDIIITIDPRPYEAALSKAKANLQSALTTAKLANTEAARAVNMLKNQAITRSLHDQRLNEQKVANAQVQAAQAELTQAQINVEYAYVRAPFDGRISRAEITIGNVVQSGMEAPLLTTIVSNDAIYADFEVDEATYLTAAKQKTTPEFNMPIELHLPNAADKIYKGQTATFDNHINPDSGTIRARATFNNTDGLLVPGMFVTVRLGANTIPNAILVPERAIGTDQNKKFVYVVGEDNKVIYREITLGSSSNGHRIVTSGLNVGERIITDGVQHVRPDAIVAPTDANAPQAPATPVSPAPKP